MKLYVCTFQNVAGIETIQEGPILRHFFLCIFTVMRLENLCQLSHIHDNFQFNMTSCGWFLATLIFFRRLLESDVTVMSSFMCMDWWHGWYNQMAHVFSSSTSWAFLTNMGEKRKSTSPNAIQVKNQRKTIGIEEKLDIISWLEKGEWNFDKVK